jgi:diguanylate cyclase (GGDEF)-like protein/PAS domain S-box-containing protein
MPFGSGSLLSAARRRLTSAGVADQQHSAHEREIAALRTELADRTTALRRAEYELREAVGHLDHARFATDPSERTDIGTWSADLTAGRYRWSAQLHRIFGTDPRHPPSDAGVYSDMIHPDDRGRVVASMRAAALGGASYNLECRIIRTDGEVRTIRGRGRFHLGDHGVPAGVHGIVQDVTDRDRFTRELQLSRDLFAGVLDAATEQSIIATDPDGLITVFNTGAERMLGYSAAEMIGTSPQRLHDWAEIEARAAELGIEPGFDVVLERARAGVPETRQWTYVTRAGHRLQVSISVTAARDRNGAINGFIKVGTDITERVKAETALRESEERFRDLFHYAPNGIVLVSVEEHDQGRILQSNPALTTLTGYTQQELQTMSLIDLISPDDLDGYHQRLAALREHRPTSLSVERHWIRADGEDLWVQCSISPKALGGNRYVVAQVEDITARRALEARLTHEALHDPLTGLPNRTLLMDRIEHALQSNTRSIAHVAVLYLDLDGFKLINDSAGHAAGDAVLVEVARRVESVLRPGDTVARLGGDEFAMVCEAVVDNDDAMKIAERALAAVRGRYTHAEHSWSLSASVGVSMSAQGSTAERMLLDADHAMYRAKSAGKSNGRAAGQVRRSRSRSA